MEKRTEIVPVKLNDGSTVNIETTLLGGDEDVSSFLPSLAEVSKTIEKIASEILEPLKKVKPKKMQVEFGLAIALESGKLTTLWVKGQGTANLKVVLEWFE